MKSHKSKCHQRYRNQVDDSTLLLSDYVIDSEDYYIILSFYQEIGIFKIFQENSGPLRIFLFVDIGLRIAMGY